MSQIRLAMKLFFASHFPKIKHHLDLVRDGKEDLVIVLWVWGGAAYLSSFFISKIVIFVSLVFIKWLLSILVITYFVWHIIIIRRCSPKNPPLSKEEQERLKKDRFKIFCRKLFLKEPFTKWNPSVVATVLDIYIIVYFLEYLLK